MHQYRVRLLSAILFALHIFIAPATADSERNQCQKQARTNYRNALESARSQAKQEYDNAQALCKASGNEVLATCFIGCEATRKTCVAALLDQKIVCNQACDLAFKNAELQCRTTTACGLNCRVDQNYFACLSTPRAQYNVCAQACVKNEDTKAAFFACSNAAAVCRDTCKSQVAVQ